MRAMVISDRHAALADPQVQMTVNRQFAGRKTPLKDGDEIACIGR